MPFSDIFFLLQKHVERGSKDIMRYRRHCLHARGPALLDMRICQRQNEFILMLFRYGSVYTYTPELCLADETNRVTGGAWLRASRSQ